MILRGWMLNLRQSLRRANHMGWRLARVTCSLFARYGEFCFLYDGVFASVSLSLHPSHPPPSLLVFLTSHPVAVFPSLIHEHTHAHTSARAREFAGAQCLFVLLTSVREFPSSADSNQTLTPCNTEISDVTWIPLEEFCNIEFMKGRELYAEVRFKSPCSLLTMHETAGSDGALIECVS
jgi:hypothetical protein